MTEHNSLPLLITATLILIGLIIIGTIIARSSHRSARQKNAAEMQIAELRKQNEELIQTKAALLLSNSELKKLSITDGLTRVFNRMHFDMEFRKEWRRCTRQGTAISVLMVDVDHFKKLNDSAGHLAGDYCLQIIAKQLYNHFKRAGELVARYGGEEFVVMLPDTNQRKALALAEGLRTAIERNKIHYNNQQHQVTVSIGISTTVPFGKTAPDHLLAAADSALYDAKRQGRNRTAMIPLLPTARKPHPIQHRQK